MVSASASKSQDSSNSTADWFALVQLQQQLLLQQQTYAAMQQPRAASGCFGQPTVAGGRPAASILYPTSPGAISVGKFPNPQTVNRLLGKG